MQAFSIEAFRSANFSKEGLMRGSNFLATIPAPRCLVSSPGTEKAQRMGFLCKAASIPGYSIAASDERPYGVGPDIKMPFGHAHSDLNLTFYIDTKYDAIDFFHAWIKSIAPSTPDLTKPFNGAYDGEVRYRKDYISDITLAHYSDNSKVAVIKFLEAWPTQINEVPLDWSAGDEVLQLQVTFTYRAYKIELVNEPVILTNTQLRGAIPTQSIASIASVARPALRGPAVNPFQTAVRPSLGIPSTFRIGQLSSMDFDGYSGANDAAQAIREVTGNISFGMNSVLSSVLGFAPVQAFLRGLSAASTITGALNSLRNLRNNFQSAINANLSGIRSQVNNITRSIGGFRIP